MLIGPPGVGKSTAVKAVAEYLRQLEELFISPTDVTSASLVDCLVKARRDIIYNIHERQSFNSMLLLPDELSNFMAEYDRKLVGKMTSFYDTDQPYGEARRTGNLDYFMESPQLSLLAGTTTSNLLNTLPKDAWEQGFMSRVVMVFSNDSQAPDDMFASPDKTISDDLSHDLDAIYRLQGQFKLADEYRAAMNAWNKGGRPPRPSHPRLTDYNTRRFGHLMKLSMVACADRGDELRLEQIDFDTALAWLVEAESLMPYVFTAQSSVDSRVMDEIAHFCEKEQAEPRLIRFIAERVPAHSVMKIVDLMVSSGMIKVVSVSNLGVRKFKA